MRDSIYLAKEVATQLAEETGKPYDRLVVDVVANYIPGGLLTLQEIGFLLDITRERVRQIENEAKAKIIDLLDDDIYYFPISELDMRSYI